MEQKNFKGLAETAAKPTAILLAVLSVLLILTLLFGISRLSKPSSPRSPQNSPDAAAKLCIGFSIDTLALERWQRDLDIFMDTVKKLGADIIVQNAGDSAEEQNKQLLYLMERKVQAVVIVAKKKDSLTETIQKLRAKNIAVIAYDRLISNADISMYISVNTEKVGELMAKQLLAQKSGHNWICMLGPEDDYNMTLIQNGVQKVIQNRAVRITETFHTDGWNYDLSYQKAVNILTGGTIPDAIICGNDAVAGSVIQAIADYYPDHHIPLCGQDADISACQYIVRGQQDFTIYKPITRLAELAAMYAVELAKGKTVMQTLQNLQAAVSAVGTEAETINNGYADIPAVWLDPQVVTKDNIDDVIIKSGFHTHGEIYRTVQ